MIYLIDHQDSFTFNLAHLLGNFDEVYVSNYFEINKNKLDRSSMVVFSPGPGGPREEKNFRYMFRFSANFI